MRLPWHNRDDDAAHEELVRAAENLAKVRGQWPAVIRESATSRAHKERNHISEAIAALYVGGSR